VPPSGGFTRFIAPSAHAPMINGRGSSRKPGIVACRTTPTTAGAKRTTRYMSSKMAKFFARRPRSRKRSGGKLTTSSVGAITAAPKSSRHPRNNARHRYRRSESRHQREHTEIEYWIQSSSAQSRIACGCEHAAAISKLIPPAGAGRGDKGFNDFSTSPNTRMVLALSKCCQRDVPKVLFLAQAVCHRQAFITSSMTPRPRLYGRGYSNRRNTNESRTF